MIALILNSGLGHRMGDITKTHPKCMTEIRENETIISRQLKQIANCGIRKVVITTGYFDQVLVDYCLSLKLPLHYRFVKNPDYSKTNYIYSIFCARKELDDDMVLMHGDLVFEESVLRDAIANRFSCMKVSSTAPLPEKDFKAVIDNGRISKVGIEYFDSALEAQALYKLNKKDWMVWLREIITFCEEGKTNVYAENALNVVSWQCDIHPLDVKDRLCTEIDTQEDLAKVREILENE